MYENVEVEVGEGEYVDRVALEMTVVHDPSAYHWYVREGVPPDA